MIAPAYSDTLVRRTLDRLIIGDDCWTLTGSLDGKGYTRVFLWRRNGKQSFARGHRFIYEILVGPIPKGLELDHVCRNRTCVNPDHLEPVTQQVNLARGYGAAAMHARQTHCVNGHEFSETNTYRWQGERHCRKCRAERAVRYRRHRSCA